jgi:hypothetical protein
MRRILYYTVLLLIFHTICVTISIVNSVNHVFYNKMTRIISLNNLHGKNNFNAKSKNCARYRSENIFILGHQNTIVICRMFKHDNVAANSFDILEIKLNI